MHTNAAVADRQAAPGVAVGIVDSAAALVAMFDAEMRYLAVSEPWLTDYGLRRETTIGRSHYELFPDIPERWCAVHRRALAGEHVRSALDLYVRADGSSQWVSWAVAPWHHADGTVGGIVISAQDVTRERELQSSLQQVESMLDALFEHVSFGIAIADADGRFLRSNAAYRALVGQRDEELRRSFIGSVVHPDDAPAVIAGIEPLRRGQGTFHESRCRFVTGDGRELPVEQLVSTIPPRSGSPLRLAVFARDVSERLAMESDLRESDHLSSVGRLGAGLAHDLGNLLFAFRSAMAGLEVSVATRADDQGGRAALDVLARGIEYAQLLTDELQALASVPAASAPAGDGAGDVELAAWWHHARPLLERAVPRGVSLEGSFGPGLPSARIGVSALNQVMVNLVVNAGQAIESLPVAMRRPGCIRISAAGADDGKSVRVTVQDNGVGMTADVRRHAFEPYYSARGNARGTGIGLRLVWRLVAAVGGSVALESTLDVGTSIVLALPVA